MNCKRFIRIDEKNMRPIRCGDYGELCPKCLIEKELKDGDY